MTSRFRPEANRDLITDPSPENVLTDNEKKSVVQAIMKVARGDQGDGHEEVGVQ